MDKKNNSYRQLSAMILITVITQFFLLIRASIVASKFGVNMELDAFNFANNVTTFIYSFIGAGITMVLMPYLCSKDKEKPSNTFITFLYGGSTLLLLIGVIFRKDIVTLFSGINDTNFITLCSNIMVIMLISQYIGSFIGLSNSILQSEGKFNTLKIIILITTVLLVILLVLERGTNIYYYSIAILITTVINVILQFILVYRAKFKISLNLDIKDKQYIKMMKSFLPVALSTGVYQLSLMIDITISARLGEGNISILNYSNYVIGMINVLLVSNITSFLYPRIARDINKEDSQKKLADYITLLNAILLFIVIAFFILGYDALGILYMRGQFTSEIGRMVYYCSVIYVVSLPVSAIRDIIYKYFYAKKDTYSPFKNSLNVSVLNIVFSIILAKYIGLYGVVLGTTITSFISIFNISVKFSKCFGLNFNKREFIKENSKIIIVTLVNIFLFKMIKNNLNFSNLLVNLLVYVTIITASYVGSLYLVKSRVFRIRL